MMGICCGTPHRSNDRLKCTYIHFNASIFLMFAGFHGIVQLVCIVKDVSYGTTS